MKLCEVEPPSDDVLAKIITLEPPTPSERMEFDRLCRSTSRFDGWDVYGQLIEDPLGESTFVLILANRAKRL